ncbi:A-kinase anchor protein 9-like isoform X4 [Denticeps clupeoides]|uniref:A-kinase anchor protein 9-like isoform X4 n=1 Tax=Denticeps clupeoides TaxID=299321 RepID=UPI0010A3206F|nr:A-kinase anchor protein 9-like isoform X4 [Denticeps clupeoides]
MEDEERQKKLEAGKAKLAEYRQRKAHADRQKKQKKKKKREGAEDAPSDEQRGDEVGGGRTEAAPAEFTFARTLRSGETVKHDQTYTIEPESEVSTTAEDYSSEVNGCHEMTEKALESSEDFYREEGVQQSEAQLEDELLGGAPDKLQDMEDELNAKNQALEDLTRELEGIRAAFGKEGVQQLQDFEAALKQRDGIITKLTANLQLARQEKDEVMREFLELTEQSHKLQIQFQQLQAGESLRNTSHSSTAADLLQARQQILHCQQQLEEKDQEVRDHQKHGEEHLLQLTQTRHQLSEAYRVSENMEQSFAMKLQEKELVITEQKQQISEHQQTLVRLQAELLVSEEQLKNLNLQLASKAKELEGVKVELESSRNHREELDSNVAELDAKKVEVDSLRIELESCRTELSASKQKERMSSGEIQQLMGTVEDLQKRCHQGSLSESEALRHVEEDATRKLDHLRAELDEMYGEQIVHMKQELRSQQIAEMERLVENHTADMAHLVDQHNAETERLRSQSAQSCGEVNQLNARIIDLQQKLQEAQVLRERARQDLTLVSEEKLNLQNQVEDLLHTISSSNGRGDLVPQGFGDAQEQHQEEMKRLHVAISDLQAKLAAAQLTTGELEAKHESEVTNYKIKLDMLEREKDAVLDRMAESQEAELERLRTQLLFSHEEELSRLRDDLQRESQLNVQNLRDELERRHTEALDKLQKTFQGNLCLTASEKEALAEERDVLLGEIAALKDALSQSVESLKMEELVMQLKELQFEVKQLREKESERFDVEEETKKIRSEYELLLKETKEREQGWENERKDLESENGALEESISSMREEIGFLSKDRDELGMKLDSVVTKNEQLQKCIDKLEEDIEWQKNTFSLAEKEFEANYQELKEEHSSLLNEKLLGEKMEFNVSRHEIVEQQQQDGDQGRPAVEKDTTELMEKLQTSEQEKEILALRLSEVTARLEQSQAELVHLEEELRRGHQDLARAAVTQAGPEEDPPLHVAGKEAESEPRQRSNAPVEGPSAASSSSSSPSSSPPPPPTVPPEPRQRRPKRRRQQLQQQQRSQGSSRLPEDGITGGGGEDAQAPSGGMRHTPLRRHGVASVGKQDGGIESCDVETQTVIQGDAEAGHGIAGTIDHEEFMLQMEAQRISLSQIHAAQLELQREQLQAEAESHLRRLGQELQESHALEGHRWEKMGGKDHKEETKSQKIANVFQAVSEECNEVVQSFVKLLGQELIESLPTRAQGEEGERSPAAHSDEPTDPVSMLHEAREVCCSLKELKEEVELEYRRLTMVHSALKADGDKVEMLQLAYEELKLSSEEEIAGLRTQIHASGSASEPLKAISLRLPESERLKAEFEEQKAHLEERHRQEIEHLRAYYQQQAKETEERYTTELILLQQRLEETTSSQAQYSTSDSMQISMQRGAGEELELWGEEDTELGLDKELHPPTKSVGLTQQLQALRKALYHKYLQEVTALKEQHRTELEKLRAERRQTEGEEVEEEQSSINGGVAVANRHKETSSSSMEEEVARVIVQMSVEFAQQTELARIAKQSRETTSAVQTQREVKEQGGVLEDRPPSSSDEELQRRWRGEVVRLKEQLEERTEELSHLREQLRLSELRGADATDSGARGREEHAETKSDEEVEERGGKAAAVMKPSMQCASMQTELLSTRGEEDEVGRLAAVGAATSSQDPDHSDDLTECNLLRKANESLLQVLRDVLKTTAAAEETIGRHVEGILEASSRRGLSVPHGDTWQEEAAEPLRLYGAQPRGDGSLESETGPDDVSLWSGETDEGLEMSHQLLVENEEGLTTVGTRLQAAVEKLLVAITETSSQLEHARVTQTELMRESFRHNEEMQELLRKQEELQERLGEEARAREQLALELHKAEGVIDGYTDERAMLEAQVHLKEELRMQLELELQVTSSRLQELEQERQHMQHEKELLSRQQGAMKDEAGPRELCLVEAAVVAAPEADLLEETEKLMKEKVEVQRQAAKESSDLQKQLKDLEAELEEQVSRSTEMEQAHGVETADFSQQIQALEKQLEKNRRFLDEQAMDREHERDVFQQEILKLEEQLKSLPKQQLSSEQRNQQVEQLTSQLREKSDWCSELQLGSEQLRREVAERNEEIEKLEERARELERALLLSSESLQRVEETRQDAPMAAAESGMLEAQLQTEREALDRKEKEICNLEEQLEQFREELENKSEEVQQLHMQLEIQRKELEAKAGLLQVMEEKDREIALLKEQLTKLQHSEATPDNKDMEEKSEQLRELESQVEYLRSEQQRLKHNSEEEVEQLHAVIEKLQQELTNIEHKQDNADLHREDFDELKQHLDEVTQELDTLKEEHGSLMERFECVREEGVYAEKVSSDLQEALSEKVAALLVAQAQVQALEQSASSQMEVLSQRVEQLQTCVEEKDSELSTCRLRVEQVQADATDLHHKVAELEDKLRENVAAALVSQAQLGAVQTQTKELQHGASVDEQGELTLVDLSMELKAHGLTTEERGVKHEVPTGKVGLLTEKLWELEEGLSSMQKDQELQKQLLSSSEEEVIEYERRLAVLMDLLNQMRTKPVLQRALFSADAPRTEVSELYHELQQARDQAAAAEEELVSYRERSIKLAQEMQMLQESQEELASTQEELNSFKERSAKLQEEVLAREMTIAQLKDKLHRTAGGNGESSLSELLQELQEARDVAASTKEELSCYQERSEKLQEELQIRDDSISQLQEELQKLRSALERPGDEQDPSVDHNTSLSELLQELQEARDVAASTEEELSCYQERSEKLQEELQIRDDSISQLQEELQKLRSALERPGDEQDPSVDGESSLSELLQELQEARDVAASTKEELSCYRERSEKLQEDLQMRDDSISQLQEELQKLRSALERPGDEQDPSVDGDTSLSELLQELQEARDVAASTKEELSSYREHTEKLREELQMRDVSISQLQEELQKLRSALERPGDEQDPSVDGDTSLSELLQELQEARDVAASTKEELSSYREHTEKLREELQMRDVSISQLQVELQKLRSALERPGDEQDPSQPKKKGKQEHHVGKNKGGGGKEKPSLSRKNSSAQSDKSSSSSFNGNGGGRTQVVGCSDVATQVELGTLLPGSAETSEDMAELIGEYQEKIGQMQDLHAAEILDMEARHISESEGLRRDVQLLEDECKSLKAVIDKLRRSEAVSSRMEHPPGSQFRDDYASDSSSDWSQRTGYDLPHQHLDYRTTPEGARRDTDTDVLPDRIKSLLREVHQEGMQVLSLSELPFGEEPETNLQPPAQGWAKEREALMATVESLKTLIRKLETKTEAVSDWRVELLGAVRQVFQHERDVLRSALYSRLELLDTSDAVIHLNQLEQRLREQDALHREALGTLHTADRNSLLMEVQQLRVQLEHLQTETGVKETLSPRQQRDCHSPVIAPCSMEQGRAGNPQEPKTSSSDQLLLEDLKSELSQTKLELETTLKAQHKHLKELETLRTEVTQKVTEVDVLTDKLADEQRRVRELQHALEKEKCKSEKKDEGEREEIEDLKLALVEQQALVSELNSRLDQEKLESSQLRVEAQDEQRQQHGQLSRQQSLVAELRVQLETQHARALELQSALERERELSSQFRQKTASSSLTLTTGHSPESGGQVTGVGQAEQECSQVEEAVGSMETLLQSLQKQLEQKHTQVVQLLGEVEAQKLEAVQRLRQWEEERSTLTSRSAHDHHELGVAKAQLESLQHRLEGIQDQLKVEKERAERLEQERDGLQERVGELSKSFADREAIALSANQTTLWREAQGGDRTRDWVLQQKSAEGLALNSSMASLHETPVTATTDPRQMDNVIQRLQLIAARIKNMTSGTSSSLPEAVLDREGLAWLQTNVDDVVSLLQQTPQMPSSHESAALLGGGSSSVLTDRLLRQNAELTGFVSRLTEEKNDLRNQLLKLEAELRHHRQRGLGSDSSSRKYVDRQELGLLSTEREAWARERSRLEKSLRQAETELSHLREEVRTSALREMGGPEPDNAALKRMYGKYLRAESFRKALIYQKKYLLLLLGGFQECEEATLALIARMGGHPTHTCLESITHRRRGFTRFRSAVRVSIALSRMRFLVRRWQKAASIGSITTTSVNRNGMGQITAGEGRNESPYLHPSSAEMYGERRGTSRGRTGRDSPRSSLSVQHRYHSVAGDPGGLSPCSHLQNYDPDRALTDYISRLEALQRRLGSVQSGSSSYAQLHFGVRR